jgi:O-antigen ligase
MATRSRRSSGRAQSEQTGFRAPEGIGVTLLGLILIYGGHYFYAGLTANSALSLCLAASIIMLGMLAHPGLRRDFSKLRGLEVPAGLFAASIIVAALSLTPYGPGGPAPVWDYIGVRPGSTTVNKTQTTIEIIKLFGLGAIFVIGALTAMSDNRAKTAVNGFVLAGGLFALWAFLLHVSGGTGHGGPRLEAHFLAPNTAGGFFAVLAVVALGPITSTFRAGRRSKWADVAPYGATLAVSLTCLVMSGSRGGAAAAAAGFTAFLLLQVFAGRIKFGRALILSGLAGVLALVVVFVAGDLFINRALEGGATAAARARMGAIHWQAFLAAPWMGYGLGSFDAVNRSLITATNFADLWNIRAVHNVYLQWLEEGGVLAALPMFASLALILFTAFRRTLNRTRMTSILFALFAAHVVVLVHGVSDFDLQTYSFAMNWAFLLGLTFGLSQGSSTR